MDLTCEKLDEDIRNLFEGRNDAIEFLLLYSEYGGKVDDIVDEEKDQERVRQTTLFSSKVYNCNYWLKYRPQLLIIDRLIHNIYFDSVEWEHSPELWKREHSKVYSHCGMLMTLSVILIEFGDEKLREFSLRLKEYAYFRHKDDKI